MIDELDAALRTLVEQEVLNGSGVEVQFDAPTKDWAARRNQPTIDIYLYDIRQDLNRRQFGVVEQRDERGVVEARRRIPTWFRMSYLVTAWTQRPEDEHRLLAALLSCFLRHERVPPELLSGSLAELGMSVPLSVALPPPQDRALSDVWSALGGELKPSLDINVVAPMVPDVLQGAGPPVTKEPRFTFMDRSRPTEAALLDQLVAAVRGRTELLGVMAAALRHDGDGGPPDDRMFEPLIAALAERGELLDGLRTILGDSVRRARFLRELWQRQDLLEELYSAMQGARRTFRGVFDLTDDTDAGLDALYDLVEERQAVVAALGDTLTRRQHATRDDPAHDGAAYDGAVGGEGVGGRPVPGRRRRGILEIRRPPPPADDPARVGAST
jgi:hypothetical protein